MSEPTPAERQGYSACSKCGTQRPAVGLRFVGNAPPVCADLQWCDRQAGKATGLDQHGDAAK